MKIKPNTFYRTRDGHKAWVASIENPFSHLHRAIGINEHKGLASWTLEGLVWLGGEQDDDLVEECIEKEVVLDYAVVDGVRYLLLRDNG